MTPFIHENFLLQTEPAKILYHNHAKKMPIIDYHNHLNPKNIYEDTCFNNLTDIWLNGDHYKWRAMRTNGISEHLITGNSDPYDKFFAWADTIQNAIGNPLYHWTHLELKQYFGIEEILSPKTAKAIWMNCNNKLNTCAYSTRNLLRMQQIKVLCTTDDPLDDLIYHKALKEEKFDIQILPTFRPEKALAIEKSTFLDYIKQFSEKTKRELHTIVDLIDALKQRLAYFIALGCRVSDHSLESDFYFPSTLKEVDLIYQKRLTGTTLTHRECAMYQGYLLTSLGQEYAKHQIVMQLHIGALRNNSTRMFQELGADIGLDSLNDFNYAPQLSALLDSMDKSNALPKIILYYLNPKDADMLATMAGNYQSNPSGIKGKIQLGSAWWFNDHKMGMLHQMNILSNLGLLSTFIGMLTDSRSFLSFSRHDYFRRILCNHIGLLVEHGEYPNDLEYLGSMIENICYFNALAYFNL